MKRTLLASACTLMCLLGFMAAKAQVSLSATTGTTTGTYTNLSNAFSAINNGTHKGVISITLTAGTVETVSASLDSSGNPTGSSYTAISIQPAAGTPVIITGSVDGALINFNGADNVTVDGFALAPGGATLTIVNTSIAATATTIRLINDASSNTVKNTTIKGAGAGITTGVVFFSTGLANGNDNNTLLNNDVDGTSSAAVCLLSIGSTGSIFQENSGNTITNCWFRDNFNSTVTSAIGVYLNGGNTDWTFTNNSFYQSAARVATVGTSFTGMLVIPTYPADKHTVTSNFFGGSAAGASNTLGNMQLSGSGTTVVGFTGFSIQTGGTGNLVSNNTVRNITLNNPSTSSYANAGFFGFIGGYDGTTTFSGNQVRDITFINNTALGYISFQAIHMNGRVTTASTTVLPVFTVSNNIVNNISATSSTTADFQFYGLRLEASSSASLTGTTTISNPTFNVSGNEVSSFTITTTGTATFLRGVGVISTNGTSSTVPLRPKSTITNNIIKNNSVGSALASYTTPHVSGIQITGSLNSTNATDVHTIADNTIFGLNATTTADIANSVAGIIGTTGTYVIERNKVYNLTNTASGATATAIVSGINLRSMLATGAVRNNFVAIGGANTYNSNYFGILNNFNSANGINIYFNTVYITGIGLARNSVAFYRGNESMTAPATAIVTPIDARNNIFYNFRSGGTGTNYAIGSHATTNWTSNYNILKGPVVGTWNGTDQPSLANWQAASSQDANSKNIIVNFVDPANGDLHLSGASNGDQNLIGTRITGITTDYDGQTRSVYNPYIGADEASIQLPVQLLSFTGTKDGEINLLQWNTATEINNKGFNLQRSTDGKDFSSIAFIATKAERGSSNSTLNYSFADSKPFAGTNYYRLQQVDNDGKFSYSSIVVIKGEKTFSVAAIYPNPAKDNMRISLTAPKAEKATLSILDMNGKTVHQASMSLISGDNNVSINISSLSNGIYNLRITTEAGEFKMVRFIKN